LQGSLCCILLHLYLLDSNGEACVFCASFGLGDVVWVDAVFQGQSQSTITGKRCCGSQQVEGRIEVL
jgi:hypothetical protein